MSTQEQATLGAFTADDEEGSSAAPEDQHSEQKPDTDATPDEDDEVEILPELLEDESADYTCECCGNAVSEQFARVFGDNSNQVHRCLNCLEKQDDSAPEGEDPLVDEEHKVQPEGEKWKLLYGVAAGKEPNVSLNSSLNGGDRP
jgi:hypothetical protein